MPEGQERDLRESDAVEAAIRALGVSSEDVAEARREGWPGLALLTARQGGLPGALSYTAEEVSAMTGVDPDLAARLWLAMGFPEAPPGQPVFGDADVEALRNAGRLLDEGLLDVDLLMQQTRVMSQALARVAAAHVEVISERIEELMSGPDGDSLSAPDEERLIASAADLAQIELPLVDLLLVYLYRRHMVAEGERRVALRVRTPSGTPELAVGFADLVGYTATAQQLDERALANLVEDFGEAATEAVGRHNGRVVKMIGDEVMFSSPDPQAALDIAFGLAAELPAMGVDLALRVGLEWGPVLLHDGDLFGTTVNVAGRLVVLARRGTVVAGAGLRNQLRESPDYRFRAMARRSLKGIGSVRTYRVSRHPRPAAPEGGAEADGGTTVAPGGPSPDGENRAPAG